MSSKLKTIEIVAGPNGSGKTTFAESFLVRTKRSSTFLNPDLIASGISTLDFERASFQAGRILIQEVKSKIEKGESFAFESTLSGRTWAALLSKANDLGYQITIYYLYLDKVQQNLSRIKARVQAGGHSIPKASVLRRYPRCFINFWNLYRPLCHQWMILNNSEKKPVLMMDSERFEILQLGDKEKFQKKFLRGMR